MPFKGKVCVVGLGYIGLPTAAMFASRGVSVVGVDVNKVVVESLNEGRITIEEPGLPELVSQASATGLLKASLTPEQADAFIIAVGTPVNEDRTADMRAVESAARAVVPYIKKGDVVVLESTSPPGTVENLVCPILAESGLDPVRDLFVAHMPERVFPSMILKELVENDRVIGGMTPEAAKKVEEIYRVFVRGEIILTDATTAEMSKLMENTFRNVNIALANELAKLCENFGISAWEVIRCANRHPRVNLHQPGPGVGGHCIAVDPWFVVEKSEGEAKLIRLSLDINDSMPGYVAGKALALTQPGGKIAVFGVTFKPDTDDTRESPIRELTAKLEQGGRTVALHDPHVSGPGMLSLEDACRGADLLVLGVHHRLFADADFEKIRGLMRRPVILDTRNFWGGKNLADKGFAYHVLGDGRRP